MRVFSSFFCLIALYILLFFLRLILRALVRARLPIDGRLATGDGADRRGRLGGGKCVGLIDGCVFT